MSESCSTDEAACTRNKDCSKRSEGMLNNGSSRGFTLLEWIDDELLPRISQDGVDRPKTPPPPRIWYAGLRGCSTDWLAALVVVRHDVVFVLTPDIVVVSFLVTLFFFVSLRIIEAREAGDIDSSRRDRLLLPPVPCFASLIYRLKTAGQNAVLLKNEG